MLDTHRLNSIINIAILFTHITPALELKISFTAAVKFGSVRKRPVNICFVRLNSDSTEKFQRRRQNATFVKRFFSYRLSLTAIKFDN